MYSKTISAILLVIFIMLGANESFGNERALNFGLQYALKRLGYYQGEIDGLKGPKTQAAINALIQDRRIDRSDVFSSLMHSARNWKERNIPNDIKDAIVEGLENELRDVESAKIKYDTIAYAKEDKKWFSVCGKINAKNAYGAYVGYQEFFAGGFKLEFDSQIYESDFLSATIFQFGDIAGYLCAFGYVPGDLMD